MNNKNALIATANRFLIRTTVILSVFFVLSGIVTVRQRAAQTREMTSYHEVSLINSENEIGLRLGEKHLTFNKQNIRELEESIKRIKTLMSRYG